MIALAFLATACDNGRSSSGDRNAGHQRVSVNQPTLKGPIGEAGIHGFALWDSWYDMAEIGYVEEEYFISGTATSRTGGPDADYVSRYIIRRPADPGHFNGTVLLDWVNVTAQFENAVHTINAHDYLQRQGYAFAHLSVQAVGVCCSPLTPKTWDPERYGELDHPGDDYAFNIMEQMAQSIRTPGNVDPMGGLEVNTILVAGQSQSANQLYDYVSEGFAAKRAVDGILVQSSVGKLFTTPSPVPLIHLLSDFEAVPDAPIDDEHIVLWEVAGSAHQDFYVGYHQEIGQGPRVTGAPKQSASADEELHIIAGNYGEQPHPLHAACILAGASFPMRYAVNAAIHHLKNWVENGEAPPRGPRYAFDDAGQLARDEHRNALGGIRYPPVDVPVARYESALCGLGGVTVPFTEAELLALYPTHTDYLCKMQTATEAAVNAGYLLPHDANDLLTRARAASNRWLLPGDGGCEGD